MKQDEQQLWRLRQELFNYWYSQENFIKPINKHDLYSISNLKACQKYYLAKGINVFNVSIDDHWQNEKYEQIRQKLLKIAL